MYNNEILFVDKFLSILKKMGVSQIPFRNEDYRNGVYEMKNCFSELQPLLNQDVHDIKLLFVDGGESDLANGIMDCNDGSMISFELKNPYYEKASIKIDEEDADYILNDQTLDVPNDIIEEMARAFCRGAGIPVNANVIN